MNVNIYYNRFLSHDGKHLAIGGIETLLQNLCDLLIKIGAKVVIYQNASRTFKEIYKNVYIQGVYHPFDTPVSKALQNIRKIAVHNQDLSQCVEIFGADHFSIKNRNRNSILIQHGISWDQPIWAMNTKPFFSTPVGEIIFRLRWFYKALKYFNNCNIRVCVDLNFINWYRTIVGSDRLKNIYYIPNPSPITKFNRVQNKTNDLIKIGFARRFIPERGTRIFSSAIKKVINRYDNVEVIFAGEGKDSNYLKDYFKAYNNVSFTKYSGKESIRFHSEIDIAVIPSIASEGTSFSVIEAMSSGCAVIASNVGGIPNQIINGYNGVLIFPSENEIFKSLCHLIENPDRRFKIQKAGWKISQIGFSFKEWEKKWRCLFKHMGY